MHPRPSVGASESVWTPGRRGSIPCWWRTRSKHACREYLAIAQREETAEHRAQTYHSLVLRGKLRTAVRWSTEREMGGVLQPGDRCTKTGDRVMEVLRAKHLEARTPTAAIMDSYPDRPP